MAQNDGKDSNKQLSWSNPQGAGNQQQGNAAGKGTEVKVEQKSVPMPTKASSTGAAIAAATTSSTAKIVGWLAVGIVAGVVIAWGITSAVNHRGSTTTAGNNEGSTVATSTMTGQATSSALLSVAAQKAGDSVAVTGVKVDAPTWVVIYESRNGTPGNVLGASLFFPGNSSGTVALLRHTVAGQTYFATERKDNGDHRFSLSQDTLVTVDNQPAWASFVAE